MLVMSVSKSSENPILEMVSRLRRLLRNVLRSTKLLNVINSTNVSKPFHNFHLRRGVGRHQRAEESDQRRHYYGDTQRSKRNVHLGQKKAHRRIFHGSQQQPREAATKQPARNR